jgi:PRTRC genetic system protein B
MAEQDGTAVMTWPRLRLDFYDTAVVMSRWTEDGRTTTYPVAVQDVVSACTTVTLGSGLLPPDVLFWRQRGQTVTLGIYVPARRWRVQVEEGAVRQGYHLPLPPLVFVGSGAAYQVFAVRRRPGNGREPLYAAPCPNVHHTGDICRGEARFPVCAADTIRAALHLFLEGSVFNSHLSNDKCKSYPEDVRQLWAALAGKKRFPLKELVPIARSVGHLFG